MYTFSDLFIFVLATYVVCHLYLTISQLMSRFYNDFMKRVDSLLNDFHIIATSIEAISTHLFQFNSNVRSFNDRTNRNSTQLLVVIYSLVAVFLIKLFNIDMHSLNTALSPLIARLFPLLSSYVRSPMTGAVNGQRVNFENITTDVLMPTLNEYVTMLNQHDIRRRNNITQQNNTTQQSATNNTNENDDYDAQSDITEIIVESQMPHFSSTSESQNLEELQNTDELSHMNT